MISASNLVREREAEIEEGEREGERERKRKKREVEIIYTPSHVGKLFLGRSLSVAVGTPHPI
jgi:hypothetical protein